MNLFRSFLFSRRFPSSSQSGMALVVVLSLLILLTILVVGFFSRTRIDRASSSAYFEENQTHILADQAVGIVQAQIDAASTQKGVPWISQPGMVRTFHADGTLLMGYKLYSDADMVTHTISLSDMTSDLSGWASHPALFVDINAPFSLNSSTTRYPILDPSAIGKVEGFEANTLAGVTDNSAVAMPVHWLYVLRDGTVVAPSGGSGNTATVPGASTANPIVGRIAFWTDDDTAKLNINTASHGYFWDIPRASLETERTIMAKNQPTLREFQRYPGHPATTSLWPVFGYKFSSEDAFADWIYDLAPRIVQGGSEGGTVRATDPITPDDDRLFSSVDELLFSAHNGNRTPENSLTEQDIEQSKFFLTARSNAPEINLFNLPRMAIWPINWAPKEAGTIDKLLAFNSTLNTSGGDVPFYLRRQDPNSSTTDASLNQALYDYIQKLTDKPIPGFGTNTFKNKYGDDTPQILTEIFDYIRSSNLYSTAMGAGAYTDGNPQTPGSKAGQVVPLKIGTTKGIGRIPVISKAIFQLYVSGMGIKDGSDNWLKKVSDDQWVLQKTPNYLDGNEKDVSYYKDFTSYQELRELLEDTTTGSVETEREVTLITRGIIYFDFFDPMYGYLYPRYNFFLNVSFSGDWTINGKALGFTNARVYIDHDQAYLFDPRKNGFTTSYYPRILGGQIGPLLGLQNYTYLKGNPVNTTLSSGAVYTDFFSNRPNGTADNGYPLISVPIEVHSTITLTKTSGDTYFPLPDIDQIDDIGDKVTFSGGTITAELRVPTTSSSELVQTYTFAFPGFTKPAPAPAHLHSDKLENGTSTDWQKVFAVNLDFMQRAQAQTQSFIIYKNSSDPVNFYPADLRLIQENDVAVSLEPRTGDKRLIAGKANLTSTGANPDFVVQDWYNNSTKRIAAEVRVEPYGRDKTFSAEKLGLVRGKILNLNYGAKAGKAWNDGYGAAWSDFPSRFSSGVQAAGMTTFPPDFDNGTFHMPDDSYVNRADEGSIYDAGGSSLGGRDVAWFMETNPNNTNPDVFDSTTFYSPNKQMPSAVMLGSLPTGVVRDKPWQTLLFRPDPGNHPGASAPKDHLLLDLFWMPVVEPYAISERFSTNGKINMNYEIMPFGGYLKRATGMYGALHSLNLTAIPESLITEYAYASATSASDTRSIRQEIDPAETLKSFEEVFSNNNVFLSETEIVNIPLIPKGSTWSANFESTYWSDKKITGDNSREVPYAHLLPRLTTRSNTFTVYYRVQSLKKAPGTDPEIWDETKDRVMADLRGSRTIERYIDPNDATIPDYTQVPDPTAAKTLEEFYRWRVLANRTFIP